MVSAAPFEGRMDGEVPSVEASEEAPCSGAAILTRVAHPQTERAIRQSTMVVVGGFEARNARVELEKEREFFFVKSVKC